jgi:UDP-glucose 4-epimerase
VLVADSTRIKRDLDWVPQYEELENIIATAWRWHTRSSAEEHP